MSILLTPEERNEVYDTDGNWETVDEERIAYCKAQLLKVYNWGNEPDPHDKERYLRRTKRQCNECWQELKV